MPSAPLPHFPPPPRPPPSLVLQGSLFEVTHRVPDVSIRVQMVGSLGDAGGGAEWRGRRVIEMRRCSMWSVRLGLVARHAIVRLQGPRAPGSVFGR